ncbi:MAG TPA: DUF1592 domain-containing protein [Polyangia bacterium]|nr:DUF1592 domain-containing protein [Polyangia bacterium]
MKSPITRLMKVDRTSLLCGVLLAAFGCTGQISGQPSNMPGGGGDMVVGGGGSGAPGAPPDGTDPGRIAIHRLNNLEYANTVKDLVGITFDTSNFQDQDGKGDSFDNIASEFGVTDQQYNDYFNAAATISDQVFMDPGLTGKIMTCTPASAADTACFKTIIQAWGLKAWRRPIKDQEITDLTKLGTDAMAGGETAAGGVKQIVKTMLASPYFLYRIEYDPDPSSTKSHPISGYELASRLSYLLWSSMPDQALFDQAASGSTLNTDQALTAQVERMLADPKGQTFTNRFAGQWLGMDKILTHNVFATAFPMFTPPVQQAMYKEGLLYFQDFLTGTSQMKDFFTASVNFVNGTLAGLYGVTGVTGDQPQRITNMTPNRQGFLGLAGFLTQSSIEYRTAPTLRGKWVQENLLCVDIPMPPANVPKLDNTADPAAAMMAQTENVAARLAMHRTMATCAACHALLDPIGLGLENFDGIGQYRTTYPDGETIDPSGVFDMKSFKGLKELATMLSNPQDKYLTEMTQCATKKLMIYSLSRIISPGDSDTPYVNRIAFDWGGGSMKDLLKRVVLSQPFRNRHGE